MPDDASPTIPHRDKKIRDPKMIGEWKIGRTIGSGSCGRVRIARHQGTGQYAAVKIIPNDQGSTAPSGSGRSPSDQAEWAQRRIETEIVVMKLMNHPNIMRLFDVWETSTQLYLIMEYIEGGELFDYIVDNADKKVPLNDTRKVFQQIISAINYCHRFNVAHRDLKPENILLDQAGNVKVADFGFAAWLKTGDKKNMSVGTACGSPHYVAPEVVGGLRYDPCASDIWSCGVILYVLLCSKLPFDDPDTEKLLAKVQSGRYKPLPYYVNPLAADLVSKMLQKNVHRRITMPEILGHPFFTTRKPKTMGCDPSSLNVVSKPLGSFAAIDDDIFANLRTLWHGTPDNVIKQNLINNKRNWEKCVYQLLVEYRDRHLEEYEPEEEALVQQPTLAKSAPPPLRHARKGIQLPVNSARSPTPNGYQKAPTPATPSIVLHSATPTLQLPSPTPTDSSPSRTRSKNPKSKQFASPSRLPNPETEEDKFFNNIVDQLNAMELNSKAEDPRTQGSGSREGMYAVKRDYQSNIVAPPPTPIRPRIVPKPGSGRGLGLSDEPEVDIFIINAHEIGRIRSTSPGTLRSTTPVPQKKRGVGIFLPGRRRPPPLDLKPRSDGEDDDNFVLVQLEDDFGVSATLGHDHPTSPSSPTSPRSNLLRPGPYSPRTPIPGERKNVQFTEELQSPCPNLIMKPRDPALRLTPMSTGTSTFSDDSSFFPQTPTGTMSPPKQSWFGSLLKFKPASYDLLSMHDLHATRDECRSLLLNMGVYVTLTSSPSGFGLDVLKCVVNEVKDPAGRMAVVKSVEFRVEVKQPSHIQTISGYQVLLCLVQEKGALSTFRLVYNRLRREWDMDAPKLELGPEVGTSPAICAGGRYDDVYAGWK